MIEHPTAQYGHNECTSLAPAIRRFCWTWTASEMSKPRGVVPSAPALTAPSFTKSLRVIWGMVSFLPTKRKRRWYRRSLTSEPSHQFRSARNPMGACVEVEPAVAHKSDQGHVRGERHLDRRAGRRRDRGDHGNPRGQGLLHDLEADTPAHHEDVPVERNGAGQHH